MKSYFILSLVFSLTSVVFSQIKKDDYENNNSRQAASNIVEGEVQEHTIFPARDRDWFLFISPKVGEYSITISGQTLDLKGEIYIGKGIKYGTLSYPKPGGTSNFRMTPTQPNVTYYIGLWATESNSIGQYEIEIGEFGSKTKKEHIATTLCPETVSYQGKTYSTIKIGNQCWLEENLDVGTMIQGSQDQKNNSKIEKYCYDNNPSNCKKYGGLYQWHEAIEYVTNAGAQGICPNGWHIPTMTDFETLTEKVNNDGDALLAIEQGDGTNTSDFSALFAGNRSMDYTFNDLHNHAFFWSSTEVGIMVIYLRNNASNILLIKDHAGNGFSVRCLKD